MAPVRDVYFLRPIQREISKIIKNSAKIIKLISRCVASLFNFLVTSNECAAASPAPGRARRPAARPKACAEVLLGLPLQRVPRQGAVASSQRHLTGGLSQHGAAACTAWRRAETEDKRRRRIRHANRRYTMHNLAVADAGSGDGPSGTANRGRPSRSR